MSKNTGMRINLTNFASQNFYKLYMFLFEDAFEGMSNDSKILYSILADKLSLSFKNNFCNKDNELFIICKRKEMSLLLNRTIKTVKKLINELKEYKLIEEEVQGRNMPNLIYLRVFDYQNEIKTVTKNEYIKSNAEYKESIRITRNLLLNERFYQLPKFLVEDENFKNMSNGSKVAYALIKDRFSLSLKNNWFNEKGEAFLIFTREKLSDMVNKSERTIFEYMKELKKYYLIEEDKQTFNKPNLIYVTTPNYESQYKIGLKNSRKFNSYSTNVENTGVVISSDCENFEKKRVNRPQTIENTGVVISSGRTNVENTGVVISSDGENFEEIDRTPTNVENTGVVISSGRTNVENTGVVISSDVEWSFLPTSHTYISHTNSQSVSQTENNEINAIKRYDMYMEIIKNNIDYKGLLISKSPYQKLINEIVEIIVETMIAKVDYYNIQGKTLNGEIVKKRMMQLEYEHIEYVLEKFLSVTALIKNKQRYLLSCLYNSYNEFDSHYTNLVKSDMYRMRREEFTED